MKKSRILGSAAVLALMSASVASAAEYRVIVLQSLTGPAAFIGAAFADGARLAEAQINASGVLGAGNTLSVEYADDATDRTQTMSLIARYAADPSVLAILGPTSGAVAVAGAASANEMQVPVMTTSNTMDVLHAGPWSFILTQPPQVTIPYIADYAAQVAGVENCTLIGIRENEAYVTLQNTFEESLRAQGVNIVGVEQIGIQDSDFAALSTKVASQDQDCVFVSAPASQAANVIVQLRQAGLDPEVRIFGHNSLASPQFVERGGAAVEGVTFIADWVPGGYDDNSRAFDAAFTTQFGRAPDNWNAIGFGGLTIMADALSRAGDAPTRESMRDALAATSGVAVPAGQGLYALDAERVPRVGMSVLTVQGGAFVLAPR